MNHSTGTSDSSSLQFSFSEDDEASFSVSEHASKDKIIQIMKKVKLKRYPKCNKQALQSIKVKNVNIDSSIKFISDELMKHAASRSCFPVRKYSLHDSPRSSFARRFSFGADLDYESDDSSFVPETIHRHSPEPESYKKLDYKIPECIPSVLYHQIDFTPMVRKKVVVRSDSVVQSILRHKREDFPTIEPSSNLGLSRLDSLYSCDTKVGSSIISYDGEFNRVNRITSLITKFEQMSKK